MNQESFQLRFNWQSVHRRVQIKSEKVTGTAPVKALYEVFWNGEYMFSVYPTFNEDSTKAWKIVENELTLQFPPGFISILGSMIEEAHIMN